MPELAANRGVRSGLRAAVCRIPASQSAVIRWIAFDAQTEAALNNQFPADSVETQSADPLTTALSQPNSSLLVLPSSTQGHVILARIRLVQKMIETKPEKPHREFAFEPSGFLGLSDSPIFEDESPATPPKKKWWQRKKTA